MIDGGAHIAVCICTYKRPSLLARLLDALADQETGGLFTYSIVVADNDCAESAKAVVAAAAAGTHASLTYCVEPRQNISLARNKAVQNALGDFVALIDDDEFPTRAWLLTLFKALNEYKVDGVLGPVKPHFDEQPPQWIIEGGFYDRPVHRTGVPLDWGKSRTGNVLLKRRLFAEDDQPFKPEFLTGGDQDFFRRMIERGYAFIWCDAAVVYEVVPPSRWRRRFLMRRAFFRGVFSLRHRGSAVRRIVESLLAAPACMVVLPVALVCGQASFMRYAYTLSYHVGRLLAVLGVNPIKAPYVTE